MNYDPDEIRMAAKLCNDVDRALQMARGNAKVRIELPILQSQAAKYREQVEQLVRLHNDGSYGYMIQGLIDQASDYYDAMSPMLKPGSALF